MKIELSEDDKKKIQRIQRHNSVFKYLSFAKDNKFNIGDILIKKIGYSGPHMIHEWYTEKVSDRSDVPRKYVYFYEDEFGIGYVCQMKSDGNGLGDHIICLSDINLETTRFIVDPDYAEHILIQGETEGFDPIATIKEKRKNRQKIYKINKKLIVPTSNWNEVNSFIETLTVGEYIWMGWNLYDAVARKYRIDSINSRAVQRDDYIDYWNREDENRKGCNKVYEVTLTDSSISHTLPTKNLVGRVILLKQPTPFEDPLEAK